MNRLLRYAAYEEYLEENLPDFEFVDFENENDPFNSMSDSIFVEEFRFSKENAASLIRQILPFMTDKHNRGNNLPAHHRILIALQWLSTGNYLWNLRAVVGCSKTTAWRCVWEFIDAATCEAMVREWLSWPTGEDVNEHTSFFEHKYHLSKILGVVDGTHIAILAPTSSPYEKTYVNRKLFHSLNVQITCGANYIIIHVDVSNVGSVHDARVWDESEVPRLIKDLRLTLLGDSAYPCRW
jgi:hypothetical protein